MHETHITVVGNVATPVDYRETANGDRVARFRLASTVRRFDQRLGVWVDGHTSFYTVWARRGLAANVASSVSIGEPVIVQGQLRISEKDGDTRKFVAADLSAHAVGHDLSRGTSAFVRVSQAKQVPVAPGERSSAGRSEVADGPAAEYAEVSIPGRRGAS
ncbi:single-stranded DNA-binding protein [Streptomyces sulphureus]|uniref:single-stranded DNA-binding protein n=1 Tax=Streptomyces sulphureus TaxID=47758 RepID=UPI00035F0C12|nr:single-stranded DNA-binding protein [Streptomyces sulphureus]